MNPRSSKHRFSRQHGGNGEIPEIPRLQLNQSLVFLMGTFASESLILHFLQAMPLITQARPETQNKGQNQQNFLNQTGISKKTDMHNKRTPKRQRVEMGKREGRASMQPQLKSWILHLLG